MAAERRRTGSLRFRVTALAAVAVLFVLAASAVLLVAAQRRVLRDSLDEALEREAVELVGRAADGTLDTHLGAFIDDDAVAQVVDGNGDVVASTGDETRRAAIAPALAAGRRWSTIEIPAVDDGDFRVLTAAAVADGEPLAVHVAAPLDDIDEATSLLARSLAAGVPVATAVLAALVWWIVGRTLAPVEAIRREVAGMGGDDLHRRVPAPAADDEIGRLARTMNGMLDRVEEASVRQQRFVADASHELRNPLTRMRTELEVDLAHPDRADHEATKRKVLEETEGLQRLVDDLLLLARSDAGGRPARSAPVDLAALVLGLAPRVAGAGLTIDTRQVGSVQVDGDRRQLERALANVVDNAVRHAQGRVAFEVGTEGEWAVVAVADDGPGVPEDQRERIFERFTRVDEARTASAGGVGLGLAIARDIVRRHGGTIALSGDGPGARFVIRLPR